MINKLRVKNITSIIENLFPLSSAEEWDKVGIQIGSKEKYVENIIVALDLTKEVMDQAISSKVDMIIVYHPFIFEEKEFSSSKTIYNYKNKIISRLQNFNIVVYSMHTAFDKEPKGMPLALKRKFSKKIKTWAVSGLNSGLIISWNDTALELSETLQKDFGLSWINTNINSSIKTISNFALLNGSFSFEDIQIAWMNNNIDLVVVSDLKWSQKVALEGDGIKYIEVPHSIEKVFVKHISYYLRNNLKNIGIFEAPTRPIDKEVF